MQGKKATENILILLLDLACLTVSLGLGFWIRYGRFYGTWAHWDRRWVLGLFLAAHAALALTLDFYHHFFRRGMLEELGKVLEAELLVYLAVLALLYMMHRSDELPRMVAAYSFMVNTVLSYASRLAFRQLMLKGYRRSRYSNRLLLVAGTADAEEAIRNILRYNEWFRLLAGVALVGDPGLDFVAGIPVVCFLSSTFP